MRRLRRTRKFVMWSAIKKVLIAQRERIERGGECNFPIDYHPNDPRYDEKQMLEDLILQFEMLRGVTISIVAYTVGEVHLSAKRPVRRARSVHHEAALEAR